MNQDYGLTEYVRDLRAISAQSFDENEIFQRLGPLAQRFALGRTWLQPKHYEADEAQGFGVHLLHEEDDHSLAVLVLSWLPGRGTPAHDHGTWAIVAGVEGVERNLRYNRLDDRDRDGYAELEVKHEFDAAEGELVCMRSGGIHKVTNLTDSVTLSVHTYGRHINHTDRSQFNPDTNECRPFIVRIEA